MINMKFGELQQKINGRKFSVYFYDIVDKIRKTEDQHCKIRYIEGICENFSTNKVCFYSDEYGFNIIPHSLIHAMVDITKEEK